MITWIIEPEIYKDDDLRLVEAAKAQGHEIIYWDDSWVINRKYPKPLNHFIVFHGSLGNASEIARQKLWKPGAFCRTENFYCSAWYSNCQDWLLNKKWIKTTVSQFVNNPEHFFTELEAVNSVFVRPDSPLKPFSGRVIHREDVSRKALDYGYYYEDENLPIILAPTSMINQEWRFVVIKERVIAGSAYIAESRDESASLTSGKEWEYAQSIADNIASPDSAYILDICISNGDYKLLELNPFSGADLYACDRNSIVKSMSLLADQFI